MRHSFPPPHSRPSVLKQNPAPSISCLHLLWALLEEGEDFLAVTAWSPIQPGGLLLGKSGKGIGSLSPSGSPTLVYSGTSNAC